MADYFNFTKILPVPPNDPLVNEVTQLNDNWDVAETKLNVYVNGGTLTLTEIGQEYFDNNFRFTVWDGAAARIPDDIDAGWSAWTAIPILAPRVARASVTPRWRNNSAYRMVELSGGVQFDAGANPWTLGGTFTITNDALPGIPAAFQPISLPHKGVAGAGLVSGGAVVAGAAITVDKPGGNTYVRIFVQYMGGPGGGNFIQLDHVWWWY